jgi:7,8-dihydropterin-6-yl-methyl-4-(beta-D-ribofuranosyl)aminobenzene 5'-phosphate synthase
LGGLAVISSILTVCLSFPGVTPNKSHDLRLTVVFNNLEYSPQLRTGWGFACVVEGKEQTILFDTGQDGGILLENMRTLSIDPKTVDAIFLSHNHGDHTGGLLRFLEQNSDVVVYLPRSFPGSFKRAIKKHGAKVEEVDRPRQIFPQVYTTGEMGQWIKEQALILDTSRGLVVVTGCAHPGIDKVARQVKDSFDKDIYLLMGGMHLMGMSREEMDGLIETFREMDIKKIAPSHCTGDAAIRRFRENWGEDFVEGGTGAVIELSQ